MRLHFIDGTVIPSSAANSIQVFFACQGMQDAGIDVTLFVPANPAATPESIARAYGEPARFRICFLPVRSRLPTSLALVRAYRRARSAAPDALYTRNRGIAAALSLRAHPPLVYEAHQFPAAARHARRAAPDLRPAERKTLFRDELVRGPRRHAIAFVDRLACTRANRVVVVMAIGKRLLESIGVPARNIVLSSGVVPPRPALARRPHQPLTIGYIGNARDKGLEALLEAARLLPALTNRPFRIRIIGLAPEELPALSRKISPSVRRRFTLQTRVPYAQMPRVLASLDIGILLTFGSKLYDYLAAGIPVVAEDSTSMRQFVDARTALLVDPEDPEAIARALAKLLDSPKLRSRLGARSRARAKHYSPQAKGKAMRSMLAALLRERYKPPSR